MTTITPKCPAHPFGWGHALAWNFDIDDPRCRYCGEPYVPQKPEYMPPPALYVEEGADGKMYEVHADGRKVPRPG